jgi:hypothetical protein
MTTFTQVDVRCAVCGTLARKAALTSTSSFGPPDLDLRPNGPARWAHELQVQQCEECGYCARSLGLAPPGVAELVQSPVYRGALEQSRLPRLARSFFCAALVNEFAERTEQAGWRFLDAAWACDDANARAPARTCRERAAEMFAGALDRCETETPPEVLHTVCADIWRRARRFDDALAACDAADEAIADAGGDAESGTAAVVAFIRELVADEDDGSRSCAEAFANED